MNQKSRKISDRAYLIIGSIIFTVLIYVTINLFFFEKPMVFDDNTSYWSKNYDIPHNKPLDTDIDVDIAVIGGGYTGLSAAWYLAKENPDKKIILLEAKTLGNGASGRHGGMILPALMPELTEDSATISKLKIVYDYSVSNIKKIEEIEKLSGISCDLVTDGFLYTIFQKDQVAPMEKFVQEFKKHGFPIEYWNKEKLENELGSMRYEGALFVRDGGSVHAMKLVHALKVLCEREKVEIFENSPVVEITEGEKIKLAVGKNYRQVSAKHIVLATNAFTSKLGYFEGKVMPLHIVTAATNPLTSKQLEEINWRCRLPFADSRIELYHLVLTPDNRIIIGGGYSNYFYNNNLDFKDRKDSIASALMAELMKMYPGLNGIKFESVWNGIIGVTMDMEEVFGITGKNNNILYALGYNGHGVNSSIMHGQVIADLYQGKNTDYLKIKDGESFMIPPEPFRFIGVRSFLLYSKWHDKNK